MEFLFASYRIKKEPENNRFSGSFLFDWFIKLPIILKIKPIRFVQFFYSNFSIKMITLAGTSAIHGEPLALIFALQINDTR